MKRKDIPSLCPKPNIKRSAATSKKQQLCGKREDKHNIPKLLNLPAPLLSCGNQNTYLRIMLEALLIMPAIKDNAVSRRYYRVKGGMSMCSCWEQFPVGWWSGRCSYRGKHAACSRDAWSFEVMEIARHSRRL